MDSNQPAVHSDELANPTAQQAGSQAQDTALMIAASTGNTTIVQGFFQPPPSAALPQSQASAALTHTAHADNTAAALTHAAHAGHTAIIQALLNPPVTPSHPSLAG